MAVQSNNAVFFMMKSASSASSRSVSSPLFPSPSSSIWRNEKINNHNNIIGVMSSNKTRSGGGGGGGGDVWFGGDSSRERIDGGFGRSKLLRLPPASLGGGSNNNNSNTTSSSSGGSDNNKNKKKGPGAGAGGGAGGGGVLNSNYVVPLDKSSTTSFTRPLAEILRDLNKRIPDNIIIKTSPSPSQLSPSTSPLIPWYHANRMLSFYAPGWCGEIRDVIFSENGSVTVVYRVTIRGSDGEAHRESSGTVSSSDVHFADPVAAAEEIAFCRACARFGLGLYMYHEE